MGYRLSYEYAAFHVGVSLWVSVKKGAISAPICRAAACQNLFCGTMRSSGDTGTKSKREA